MEGDTTVRVGALGSIFKVALYGATDFGELTTNLVVATCEKLDIKQCITVAATYHFVVQACLLGIFVGCIVGVRAVGLTVTQDIVAKAALLCGRSCLDDSPIVFGYLATLYHLVESHKSLRGLGKEHSTRDRAVYAVYDPEKDIEGFIVAHLDECLDFVFESSLGVAIWLHKVTRTLIYNEQMIVLIQNIVWGEHRLQVSS